MPRQDGRSRAPNAFGKPGKKFEQGSLAHPTITEQRTDSQDAKPKPFLTAHDRTATALLVAQDSSPGDNNDAVFTEQFETLPGPALTSKEMSEQASGAVVNSTTQKLVAGTAAPSLDFKSLAFSDKAIDANRIERSLITLPDSAFPSLAGTHVDEQSGIKVDFTKQIVAASTTSSGTYDEIQPLNKWRSIQIVSSLNVSSLPINKTYGATIRHSFPNILESLDTSVLIVGSTVDVAMKYQLTEGYSGPCVSRITEKWLTGAAYEAYTPPAITKYKPQSTQFFFYGSINSTAKIFEFRSPLALHGTITPTVAGLAVDPTTLPATDPVGYSSGDYIYVDVQPEKWRFGVWHIFEIEAKIP